MLQWVHGRITVVMGGTWNDQYTNFALQWVHGRITVVMRQVRADLDRAQGASMGPRSDNRGYAMDRSLRFWVLKASMGPRSDNRGYGGTGRTFLARRPRFNGSTVG